MTELVKRPTEKWIVVLKIILTIVLGWATWVTAQCLESYTMKEKIVTCEKNIEKLQSIASDVNAIKRWTENH